MEKIKETWMKHIDKVLLWLLTIFVGGILISQSLLLKEGTRLYLSKVDKMEGEDITFSMPLYADQPLLITEEATVVKNYQNLLRRSKTIVITMIKGSHDFDAFVMVNGKKTANFRKGTCKLAVYDGDYVEIDGTSLSALTAFRIDVPGNGLLSPQDGLIVEGKRGTFLIGKIKFKNE